MLPTGETGVEAFRVHGLKSTHQHSAVTLAERHRGVCVELTVGKHREVNRSLTNVNTDRVTSRQDIFCCDTFQCETTRTHVSKHRLHEWHALLRDGPLRGCTLGHHYDIAERNPHCHRRLEVVHGDKVRGTHELSAVAGAMAHVLIDRQSNSDARVDDELRCRQSLRNSHVVTQRLRSETPKDQHLGQLLLSL